MITILERHYPVQVIRSIVTNHLRVDESDAELFEHARMCVINAFEAAEDYTNRVIIESQVGVFLDDIEDRVIELPVAPMQSTKVYYAGVDGGEYVLPVIMTRTNSRRTIIELSEIPMLNQQMRTSRVRISGLAGFRDYAGDRTQLSAEEQLYVLPGAIEQAVALMAGTFFENIADNTPGSVTEIPTSAKALLYPYRRLPYGL